MSITGPSIPLDGEYADDPRVMGLTRDTIEDGVLDQLQTLIDHEAFTNQVRVMPDTHVAKGAVIGFTMPLGEKIVPNVIGVDIGCFTGDTEVPLADGKQYRLDELAKRTDPFVVYSCKPDGEIVFAEATARKTRTDAPLVKVTLDNGEEITCTPDHEFMLRDGTYTEASDLSDGESLMPLYTQIDQDGYRVIKQNKKGMGPQREHWVVARSGLLGDIPSYEDQKTVIHHQNFTKTDNRPQNLRFMGDSDHSRLHRELSLGEHWQSEEFEEARIQAVKERANTEEGYEQNARVGTENIVQYMEENPEEWYAKVADNGEHGREFLKEWNKSEAGRQLSKERANKKYECEYCGEGVKSYINLYNHKVEYHPEEADVENHRDKKLTCEVCGIETWPRHNLERHQKSKHPELVESETEEIHNHKVVSVERLDRTEDVYCLTVPEYHNFALSAGVFVHNCGMQAACLGDDLTIDHETLDTQVRDRVPMGWGPDGLKAPRRDYYHVKDDFPWDAVNRVLDEFIDLVDDYAYADRLREFRDNGGYDIDYFKELVNERAATMSYHFDMQTAISAVGTLGSGNHFIELAQSAETSDYWLVLHSGSRALGSNTAEYWQDRATEHTDDVKGRGDDRADRIRDVLADYPDDYVMFNPDTVSDNDLLDWVLGGKGSDFINFDAIQPPEDREAVKNEIKEQVLPIAQEDAETAEPLDFLEGDAAAGYLIDMIFCQRYASENRKLMAGAVADELDVPIIDEVEAVHNFVDFRDGIIRKGATRAYEGERAIVPFNMSAGTLLVEGKSNPEWNYSVCHGAGRVKSRTQATDDHTEDEIRAQMEDAGAYASELPVDEAPDAYKDPALIETAIEPTATIIDRLEVVHNWKAPE